LVRNSTSSIPSHDSNHIEKDPKTHPSSGLLALAHEGEYNLPLGAKVRKMSVFLDNRLLEQSPEKYGLLQSLETDNLQPKQLVPSLQPLAEKTKKV
jgi:hypothetical protein